MDSVDSNCANYGHWTDSWIDEDIGGSVEIEEGMACNPGSTTTCQSDGGSPATWACGTSSQYGTLPDDPEYFGIDCNGYLEYRTSVEVDDGPFSLPSDDSNNNYDSCNLGNCYIRYDLHSVSSGTVYSDSPAFCYDEDCLLEARTAPPVMPPGLLALMLGIG